MRMIQPYPDCTSSVRARPEERIACPVPVYHVRYRYPHHASASGYDRLCDYIGETITLSRKFYWMGETLWRIPAVCRARLGGHLEYSRYDWVMEQEVIRHFLTHQQSVYHFVHGDKSYERLARYAGRNGNKIVLTMHQPAEKHGLLFRTMDFFRMVDFVIVVSRAQMPFWEEFLGRGKVAYVPYAVDTEFFIPRVKEKGARVRQCLFIGMHDRDFDCLAQLVPKVLAGAEDVEFLMISSDARCGEIAQRDSRVQWRKRVDDEEYRRLLAGADLLVIPALRSTTNTAVLEALACGLPVITNHGGIEDYLSADCARVFSVGDADGMAGAVLELIRDPALWTSMSESARKRAESFSWGRTAEAMKEIYQRLLAGAVPEGLRHG